MKKYLYLLTLVVFVLSAPLAMAADNPPPAGKPAGAAEKPSVNCCIKGQCKQVASEADCTKATGKVVKDCKDCK